MSFRVNKRLLLSLIYLGLLLRVAGTIYVRVQHFEGQLYLAQGVTEHLVVAPHDPQSGLGVSQKNVEPDILLLDNPKAARRLQATARFDGVLMPTGLRFDRREILKDYPDKQVLVIQGPGGSREELVAPGDSIRMGAGPAHVALDGSTSQKDSDTSSVPEVTPSGHGSNQDVPTGVLEIDAISPWTGLIRYTRGQPMATLTVRPLTAGDEHLLFLQQHSWFYPGNNDAVTFVWHENEGLARKAAAMGRASFDGAGRWGVRDGQAIQWIQGVAPGSGIVLGDGARVTLLQRSPDKKTVVLRVERDGAIETQTVYVNAAGEADDFFYEDPAQADDIIVVHGWKDGAALVQRIGADDRPTIRPMEDGENWLVGGVPEIELGQVLGAAVPYTSSEGELTALYCRHEGKQVVLREGLVRTLGDYRLEYRRVPQPPDVKVFLSVVTQDGTVKEETHLSSGQRCRVGTWVFQLAPGDGDESDSVILSALRKPGGWSFYLGVSLFVLGSVGLVGMRFVSRA